MTTSGADSVAATRGYGVLINRNFALLWGGQVISNVGDYVFTTALILWIGAELAQGQAWAPLAVSGVMVAQYLPELLVAPVAGVFVDRWPKRPTMLHMDALRAALIGALVIVPLMPNSALPVPAKLFAVFGAVLIESTAAQFYSPSRFAMIRDLVDEEHQAQATGLSQATLAIAVVIGPAIAAPLVFLVGVEWALVADALSFVVSFLAVLAMRPPKFAGVVVPVEGRRFWSDFRDGIRVLLGHRTLVGVLLATLFSMLGLGTMMALGYFFLTENLHAPAAYYGALSAVFGIGAILAGAGYSIFARRINMAKLMWISMLALGVVMVLLARSASIAPAFVIAFFFGPAFAGVNVATGPLLMAAAPREYVGRISSVLNPAESLSTIFALVGAGWVDSTILQGFRGSLFGIPFGPVDTCFTVAGILTFIGGLIVFGYLRGHRATASDEEATTSAAPEKTAIASATPGAPTGPLSIAPERPQAEEAEREQQDEHEEREEREETTSVA